MWEHGVFTFDVEQARHQSFVTASLTASGFASFSTTSVLVQPSSCSTTMPKYLYPTSHSLPALSESQLALKIARHSRCATCSSCTGLVPPLGYTILPDAVLDSDDVEQFLLESTTNENDDEPAKGYLNICCCTHGLEMHGADKSKIGQEEFMRRARVAIRLDELLQVRGTESYNITVITVLME